MGSIFSVFKKSEFSELIINFDHKKWEDSQPSGSDSDLHEEVCQALAKTPKILEQLENYKPRSDYIRKAMSEPTPENELEAFQMVTDNAEIIAGFWKFSKEMELLVPKILNSMCTTVDEEKQPLLTQQAIAKKLAEIFDFVLKFDELKMLRPGLQNDFSFYRRSLGKHAQDPDLLVRDDDASFISLFLAAHIPMMTALSKTTAAAFQDDENITSAVANVANACQMLLKHKKFPKDHADNKLCLRAMVGAVVLFDHVEPEGAFHKRSPIYMKGVAQMLVRDFARDHPGLCANPKSELQNLISALRYSTMHFSDDSTPQNIADLLDQ